MAIFRKRLLAYSETFIALQGSCVPQVRPLFCGYTSDNSGSHLLGDHPVALLDEHSILPALGKFALRMGLPGNRDWLRTIRDFPTQLIHAHFFNDGMDALQIGRKLNLPVLTTLHGHDITKHDNARSGGARTRRFFSEVNRVIAVSDFIAEHALQRGCPEKKLLRHYIGIDTRQFDQAKLESSAPKLLFVGRLVEKKGLSYLLQALETLQPQHPELSLTVVGEGHLKSELIKEARERSVQVEFVGAEPPEAVRRRMAEAWLFAAPSVTSANGDAEGLGMVFLEAQAMRTPVVSFASGGIPEAVEHETSGLLCAERDVGALAANIDALLRDSATRRRLGENGRLRVERHFDIRRQGEELGRIYGAVCG